MLLVLRLPLALLDRCQSQLLWQLPLVRPRLHLLLVDPLKNQAAAVSLPLH